MSRKYTKKILDLLDQGFLDKDILIRDLLNWISESDVEEFFNNYRLFDNEYEGSLEED